MSRTVWLACFVIAIAIGIAGTAYVYFGGKTFAMTVCQGEARQGCGGIEHWINCETDPVAWIKTIRSDACINVSVKKLSGKDGGKCGYATLDIKCSSR